MGLLKRMAVRGIATELVRQKLAFFPSKEAMDAAADMVADQMPNTGPEMSGPQGHSPEDAAAIGNKLIEIGKALLAQAGGGSPEAGGPPPDPAAAEAAKMGAENLTKAAASYDYRDLASEAAESAMDKVAAEIAEKEKRASGTGTLTTGGTQENTPSAAAKNDAVAALDQQNRPQGKYVEGQGNTQFETNKGSIGDLHPHPVQPSNSPSGSNSVSKSAMEVWVGKIAEKLIHGGDHKNTPEAAAKVDPVAALDLHNRPAGKYLVGQGNTNFSEPQAARVGKEQPHPVQPSNSPGGTNSVEHASKAASDLNDDEKAYLNLFSKTAADVGPYLPEKMAKEQKIAAIRQMMGLDHDERQGYLTKLHKVGGDISAMMAEMKHEPKKEETVHHEPKKEEPKKDETKKEGSLLAQIGEVAGKYTTPAAG